MGKRKNDWLRTNEVCSFSHRKRNWEVNEVDALLPFVLSLLSTKMSSAPKESQRHGPTESVTFTQEEATNLFQRYLNKKFTKLDSVDGGLNNLLFFIKCENDQERYF